MKKRRRKKDNLRNLFKFVLVLLSASVKLVSPVCRILICVFVKLFQLFWHLLLNFMIVIDIFALNTDYVVLKKNPGCQTWPILLGAHSYRLIALSYPQYLRSAQGWFPFKKGVEGFFSKGLLMLLGHDTNNKPVRSYSRYMTYLFLVEIAKSLSPV